MVPLLDPDNTKGTSPHGSTGAAPPSLSVVDSTNRKKCQDIISAFKLFTFKTFYILLYLSQKSTYHRILNCRLAFPLADHCKFLLLLQPYLLLVCGFGFLRHKLWSMNSIHSNPSTYSLPLQNNEV